MFWRCVDWQPCNGTRYRYIFNTSFYGTFDEAKHHCQVLGRSSMMATPLSLDENVCINSLRVGLNRSWTSWLGFRNRNGTGWRTLDGQNLIYTNWRANLTDARCAVMYWDGSGTWNNIGCSGSRHVMCQRGKNYKVLMNTKLCWGQPCQLAPWTMVTSQHLPSSIYNVSPARVQATNPWRKRFEKLKHSIGTTLTTIGMVGFQLHQCTHLDKSTLLVCQILIWKTTCIDFTIRSLWLGDITSCHA